MNLMSRSMTGRLLFWQFLGVTTILLSLGLFFYGELRHIVLSSADHSLLAKAQIFTGLLHEEHGRVEMELSEIIAGEYVIPRSGHYYRVMTGTTILAVSPSLVDAHFVFVPTDSDSNSGITGEWYATAVGPAGEPVRLLQLNYRAFGSTFNITLAENLSEGRAMIASFRRFLLISLPLGILLLSLATWWITRSALAPLARFSATIETITHRNLDERLDTCRTVRELHQLASSFNGMLNRFRHVFESQKRLVADASHELKTPLSVIRTQCDVTLHKDRSPEEYGEAIRTIKAETIGITCIVNDLLSLARLDAGLVVADSFVTVRVSDLIDYTLHMTEPLAIQQQVMITAVVEDSVQIHGIQSSLEEALLNLVENAVRYNKIGGDVHITAARMDNGETVIKVSDTGIGIARADLERIFERFYRADAARNSDGSGLGLSIVKAIVEGHGGSILVESEPGRGSRFMLIFPAAAGNIDSIPFSRAMSSNGE